MSIVSQLQAVKWSQFASKYVAGVRHTMVASIAHLQ